MLNNERLRVIGQVRVFANSKFVGFLQQYTGKFVEFLQQKAEKFVEFLQFYLRNPLTSCIFVQR